jgi:O-antigen/teichoic acid export membrane protein
LEEALKLKAVATTMNSFLKKTITAGLTKALGALSGFALTLIVTRTLGADESGYFMLSLAIITILVEFFRLGMDNLLVKYVGAKSLDSSAQSLVNQSIKWVLEYSTVGAFILFFTAQLISEYVFDKPNLEEILKVFSFCIPFVCIFTLLSFAFQGLHKVILATIFQNLGISTLFITTFGIIYFLNQKIIYSAYDFAIYYTLSSIFMCIFALFIWFNPKQVKFSFTTNLKEINEVKVKRNQLWLAAVMSLFIQWGGIFFVGIYAEASEIAYFSAAQRSAMLISFVLMVVNLVAAPKYSYMWSRGDIQGMHKLSNITTKYMLLLISPLILVLLSFSDFVMSLFGDDFENASFLFSILVVGQFINVATGSVGYLLNMSGHEKDVKNITVCTGLFTLLLTFLLTKYFSVFGAALGTTIGLATQNILALLVVKKRLGFWTFI